MLSKLQRNQKGFTLIELMIVIVIIGILAALAIPRFMSATDKAKRSEAVSILKQIYVLERSYWAENSVYSANFADIGFDDPTPSDANANNGKYWIFTLAIGGGGANFTATATELLDTNGDGDTNDTYVITDQNPEPVYADN